jgi:hypothetical protein
VWDDDRHLEVRAIGADGSKGYIWQATWKSPVTAADQRLRFVLLPRDVALEEVHGEPFMLPNCR